MTRTEILAHIAAVKLPPSLSASESIDSFFEYMSDKKDRGNEEIIAMFLTFTSGYFEGYLAGVAQWEASLNRIAKAEPRC